ncbi:hypothetical protein [Corynebacterium alimapuense]|uniref:Leucine rich repeat variant domain-containing protein n=1 Tax=Corynebacterium alimapuense TaxID=1576874 RepID=A0A3M8KAX1_9CORY|nr:hypothetical protein [Corynebacterium alimapuense]RNE49672.1 hypothetical protein C5L39_04885 [Corynebacterium alimapuense]
MAMEDPSDYIRADIFDPNLTSAELSRVAFARPDLQEIILSHPNCPVDLAAQLGIQAPPSPSVDQAPTDAQPIVNSVESDPNPYAAPTAAEPVAPTAPIAPPAAAEPSAPSTPAASAAAGAAGWREHIPNAEGLSFGSAKSRWQESWQKREPIVSKEEAPDASTWQRWAPFVQTRASFVLLGATVLSVISLFLPLVRTPEIELFGYVAQEAVSFSLIDLFSASFLAGLGSLFFLISMIVLALMSVLIGGRELRLAAGVAGVIIGFQTILVGLGATGGVRAISSSLGFDNITVGLGLILLSIFAVIIVLSAIAMIIPAKAKP